MMADVSEEQIRENPADNYPLLMERQENHENQHVIDMESESSEDTSSSSSSSYASPLGSYAEMRSAPLVPTNFTTSATPSGPNSHSRSLRRRNEGFGRRRWSPFNTLLWIFIEFVFTVGQIIAAVVVLSRSQHENPQTPLFAWVLGYAAGCAATMPLLFWRYLHRNQGTEEGSAQIRNGPSQLNTPSEPSSYITISFSRSSEEENGRNIPAATWNAPIFSRLNVLVDHFKMALDCFFAVWFVVGNVWIFGGHSSFADAPNLYRLCIAFLTFSCIGYAMPFILCGMICCCLPCVISVLGIREDMNRMRGASDDSINALPTHKFRMKRNGTSTGDANLGIDEGGFVAAGTEKERAISWEDAVCCICLARYTDNDSLRELPCSHFFHTKCVDKWLKINASCPLCKSEIVSGNESSLSSADSSRQVEC